MPMRFPFSRLLDQSPGFVARRVLNIEPLLAPDGWVERRRMENCSILL